MLSLILFVVGVECSKSSEHWLCTRIKSKYTCRDG